MIFDESYGIRLISSEKVEYHYIKLPNGCLNFKDLISDSEVHILTYCLNKDKLSVSFCIREGKKNQTLRKITKVSDYYAIIGNCELFTFSAYGAAKSGIVGKAFKAAERSNSDILAVCQSDIGLSLCVSQNTNQFKKEVCDIMKNSRD